MTLLRYDGPDGITYDRVVIEVDGDGQPCAWAPFTLNRGDTVDGVAVNPDERVFVELTGKAAKAATPVRADNDVPSADDEQPPTPDVAPPVAVTPDEQPPTSPDAATAANTPQE